MEKGEQQKAASADQLKRVVKRLLDTPPKPLKAKSSVGDKANKAPKSRRSSDPS